MGSFEYAAVVAGTFLLAGAVKGVVGLGLPTVSIAVLTVALGLPQAMALLVMPALVTNLWQALGGPHTGAVLARIWPFLIAAGATVWIGALALTRVELGWLVVLLGCLLAIYAAFGLAGWRLSIPPARERMHGAWLGAINGVLTGMTGSYAVPGVMYLQALGLGKDALIQAMGMLFAVSSIGLGLALGGSGLMGGGAALESVAAVLPSLIGMALGQRIRSGLSEARFRTVFFVALMLLGLYIVITGWQTL